MSGPVLLYAEYCRVWFGRERRANWMRWYSRQSGIIFVASMFRPWIADQNLHVSTRPVLQFLTLVVKPMRPWRLDVKLACWRPSIVDWLFHSTVLCWQWSPSRKWCHGHGRNAFLLWQWTRSWQTKSNVTDGFISGPMCCSDVSAKPAEQFTSDKSAWTRRKQNMLDSKHTDSINGNW